MTAPRRRDWWLLLALLGLVYGGMYLWRARSESNWAREIAASVRPGEIVMFSTQSCVYCAKARRWLDDHHIPFTECDIERSPACLARYQALGGIGTPTFEVRGARLVGFSPQELAEALQRPAATPASGAALPALPLPSDSQP